jgi:23S rRNA (cytidine2498-2'-O)-methyltransferase
MSGGRRGGRSSDPKKESGLPKRENKERRRVTSSGPVRPPKPEGPAIALTSRALKAGGGRFLSKSPPRSDGTSKPARGPKRGEDFGRVKAGASRKPDAFGAKPTGGKFAGGKAAGGKFGDKAGKASRGEDAKEDFVPRPRGKFAGYPVGGASKDKAPPRGPRPERSESAASLRKPARSAFEARPKSEDRPRAGARNVPVSDSPRVQTGASRGTSAISFISAAKAEARAAAMPSSGAKRGPKQGGKGPPRHGTPQLRPGKQSAADKEANGPQHTSPRVAIRAGTPLPGTWIWSSREDTTSDLIDELTERLGERGRVREIEAALVESRGAPTFEDTTIDVTFARQGFLLVETLSKENATEANVLAHAERLLGLNEKLCIQVWAPDTESGNRRMPECAAMTARLEAKLVDRMPEAAQKLSSQVSQSDGAVLHVVIQGDGGWLVGESKFASAISPFVAGRARMRIEKDKPSRAARKVEEALHWMGIAPGSGEVCVDLGAAPGGWSWVLLEKRARVIAVDPAELRDDVAKHRGLKHVKASAFQFEPDEQVDWLFCDMAWRPLEAAQLLAKWGRRKWARVLVANLKLPMKQKHKMVEELRAIVNGGGWKRVRTRQLYHDRDEITLIALS